MGRLSVMEEADQQGEQKASRLSVMEEFDRKPTPKPKKKPRPAPRKGVIQRATGWIDEHVVEPISDWNQANTEQYRAQAGLKKDGKRANTSFDPRFQGYPSPGTVPGYKRPEYTDEQAQSEAMKLFDSSAGRDIVGAFKMPLEMLKIGAKSNALYGPQSLFLSEADKKRIRKGTKETPSAVEAGKSMATFPVYAVQHLDEAIENYPAATALTALGAVHGVRSGVKAIKKGMTKGLPAIDSVHALPDLGEVTVKRVSRRSVTVETATGETPRIPTREWKAKAQPAPVKTPAPVSPLDHPEVQDALRGELQGLVDQGVTDPAITGKLAELKGETAPVEVAPVENPANAPTVPIRSYHGTTAAFDQFTNGEGIGPHFGTIEQANAFAQGEGANVRPVDLHFKNSLRLPDGSWENPPGLAGKLYEAGIITEEQMSQVTDAYRPLVQKYPSPRDWPDVELKAINDTQFENLRQAIQDKGYDSIVYDNMMRGEGKGDSYIALNPSEQVRPAGAATEPAVLPNTPDPTPLPTTPDVQGVKTQPVERPAPEPVVDQLQPGTVVRYRVGKVSGEGKVLRVQRNTGSNTGKYIGDVIDIERGNGVFRLQVEKPEVEWSVVEAEKPAPAPAEPRYTAGDQYVDLIRKRDAAFTAMKDHVDSLTGDITPEWHATFEDLTLKHEALSKQVEHVGYQLAPYDDPGYMGTRLGNAFDANKHISGLFGKGIEDPHNTKVVSEKTGNKVGKTLTTYDAETVRDALAEVANEPWGFGEPPADMKQFGPWLNDILSGKKETRFRNGVERMFGEEADRYTGAEVAELKRTLLRRYFEETRQRNIELPEPFDVSHLEPKPATAAPDAGVNWERTEAGKQGMLVPTEDVPFSLVPEKAPAGKPFAPKKQPKQLAMPSPGGTSAEASAGGYARPRPHPAPTANAVPLTQIEVAKTPTSAKSPLETPELVELTREVNGGKYPQIVKQIRSLHGTALGVFRHNNVTGDIALRADIFLGDEITRYTDRAKTAAERKASMGTIRQQVANQTGHPIDDIVVRHEKDPKGKGNVYRVYAVNPELAPKVLAHEIGHLADWLPNKDMRRGNILGHVATLNKFLKTTISELPMTPDGFLSAKERSAFRRQAEKAAKRAGEGPDKVAARYTLLVEDAIQKRGLVTRDEIMAELKALTQEWKPFNDAIDPKYTAYRYSPKELYADAVSVLFNDPSLAEMHAPKFSRSFMNYLERKPEVKAAYEDIQTRYTNREAVVDNRLKNIYEMQRRGNAARAAAVEQGQKAATSIYDTLMAGLVDDQHSMLKGARNREKAGGTVAQAAREARLGLEESRYVASEVGDYFYRIDSEILKQMAEKDISYEDVGAYMFLKRVGADRAQMANPLGHTVATAAETLSGLEARLGTEKFKAVRDMVEGYRALRESVIFPRVEQSGIYTPDLMTTIKDAKDYGKFSVAKYLEDKFGGQVSAAVHKQVGTLGEIENPFVATVLQDVSMLRAAKINETKAGVIADLQNGGQIAPAELKYSQDIGGQVPKEPKNPELGILTVMEDGKPVHYYVDREIARTFQYEPAKATLIAQTWGVVNGVLRDLLVSKNPIWQARNVVRDVKTTVKNVPEIGLRDLPKLGKYYGQAVREVWREVFKGERSPDVSAARNEYAMQSGRVYSTKDVTFENEIERMVSEFVSHGVAERPSRPVVKQLRALYNFLDKTGQVSEKTGKLAGYKYLKSEQPNLGVRERAHIVRTRIGTPDYMRRGKWQAVTNNVFMFSNVNKEGLRSAYESYRSNPARYAWKVAAMDVLPKLMLRGAQIFAAKTILGQLINKVDEYDKRMYTVIPLGLVNDGEDAIYLRIPQDYEGQAVGAAVWDALDGKFLGKEGVVSTLAAQNPYKLNPVLDLAHKAYQYAALGVNPVDEFRGRNVLSDQAYAAGGTAAAGEFGAHAWNNLGGQAIYRAKTAPEIITDESTLQKMLRMPGGSVLGSFLRISHNGETSMIYDELNRVRSQAARGQLDRKAATVRAINEGKDLGDTYSMLVEKKLLDPRKTSIREFARTYDRYAAKKGDVWESAIENARTGEEREAIEKLRDEQSGGKKKPRTLGRRANQ